VAVHDPDNWSLDVIEVYLGTAGRDVANALLITSLFACVLPFHNVVSRYQCTLAGNGYFHHAARSIHARHGSPHVSSVIQTSTAAVVLTVFALAGLDPLTRIFSAMAGVATGGFVTLMVLTCVAVCVFGHRSPQPERVLALRVVPVIAAGGLIAVLVLVVRNFPLVVGGGTGLAVGLGSVPVLAFVLGCVVGARWDGSAARGAGAGADDAPEC